MAQVFSLSEYKPFRPLFSDLDYADVDYRSYGPINYKAASIAAADAKKNAAAVPPPPRTSTPLPSPSREESPLL
ncbi:hypothetical protein RUM43_009563 [Polyplax serrata]|uniref:Uncharacterized protein n=1 Tax=Polyplax serrata TaxID=468196 RepID=A0AAN8NQQ8_POLSC